jgi:L-methionine (R)-S-oxide reductase
MTTTDSIDFDLLNSQLIALTEDEPDLLANSANFVALLYAALTDINWLGIYVLRNNELVLGPFQGKAACVRIPMGQGVCGTAAQSVTTLRIDNVHDFAGHIACDAASNAELVVPLRRNGELLGVLDIDSPVLARFSERDQLGIEKLCRSFEQVAVDKADGGAFL